MILVEAGLWSSKATLPFFQKDASRSAESSFVRHFDNDTATMHIKLRPLDEVPAQYALDSVDFIKMDIEGSERMASRGSIETLRRFKPRMALASYHVPGDAEALVEIARQAEPSYRVSAKDVETRGLRVRAKGLFFTTNPQ